MWCVAWKLDTRYCNSLGSCKFIFRLLCKVMCLEPTVNFLCDLCLSTTWMNSYCYLVIPPPEIFFRTFIFILLCVCAIFLVLFHLVLCDVLVLRDSVYLYCMTLFPCIAWPGKLTCIAWLCLFVLRDFVYLYCVTLFICIAWLCLLVLCNFVIGVLVLTLIIFVLWV